MLRITLLPPFSAEFFGGNEVVEARAGNLFALIEALGRIGPGFAAEADSRAAFAVNGTVSADWTAPLPPDAEVTLFQRVAGG